MVVVASHRIPSFADTPQSDIEDVAWVDFGIESAGETGKHLSVERAIGCSLSDTASKSQDEPCPDRHSHTAYAGELH